MAEKISRPPAVWGTQLILFIFGAIWAIGGIWNGYFAFTTSDGPAQLLQFALPGILLLVFSGAALTGFWGLAKRKIYGRAIGVIMLSLMFAGGFLRGIFQSSGSMGSRSNAESAGGFFGAAVLLGLLGLLIYGLAFGKEAAAFFSRNDAPSESPEPPPPPTFD